MTTVPYRGHTLVEHILEDSHPVSRMASGSHSVVPDVEQSSVSAVLQSGADLSDTWRRQPRAIVQRAPDQGVQDVL